jgi:hypothetical protein
MIPSYSFLNISGTTLTLTTSMFQDTGTYNVNITVGLTDYTSVSKITVPLTVIISCQLT